MPRDINMAPPWCPDAVADESGWRDPRTGELLVSLKGIDLKKTKVPELNEKQRARAAAATPASDDHKLVQIEEPTPKVEEAPAEPVIVEPKKKATTKRKPRATKPKTAKATKPAKASPTPAVETEDEKVDEA